MVVVVWGFSEYGGGLLAVLIGGDGFGGAGGGFGVARAARRVGVAPGVRY